MSKNDIKAKCICDGNWTYKEGRRFYCREEVYCIICDYRGKKGVSFGNEYIYKSLDNFNPKNESQMNAKKLLQTLPLESYFIWGDIGAGKTHLLAGLFDRLYEEDEWKEETKIFTEIELILTLKETKYNTKFYQKDHNTLIDEIRNREIRRIIIDDMRKINVTEEDINLLYLFYNDVNRFGCKLVISSNYNLEYIKKVYGGAITRRIDELLGDKNVLEIQK